MARARARARALERHVLEHVGHAVELGRFRGACRRRPRCRARPISTSGIASTATRRPLERVVTLTLLMCVLSPCRTRLPQRRHALVDQALQRDRRRWAVRRRARCGPSGRRAGPAAPAVRPSPSAPHRGTWRDAPSTARSSAPWRRADAAGPRHSPPRYAVSSVTPKRLRQSAMAVERAVVVEPAGIEQLAHAAQRIGADLERAAARGSPPSPRPAPCRRGRRGRTAGARSCSKSGCPCWGCRSARRRSWSWRPSRRSAPGCRCCWSPTTKCETGSPIWRAA